MKDVDFGTDKLIVRSGKGGGDRSTLLPSLSLEPLQANLARVRLQHHEDLQRGAAWVELPHALGRKYPNAGRELGVAVGVPRDPHLRASPHRTGTPAPLPRVRRPACGQGGAPRYRDRRTHTKATCYAPA